MVFKRECVILGWKVIWCEQYVSFIINTLRHNTASMHKQCAKARLDSKTHCCWAWHAAASTCRILLSIKNHRGIWLFFTRMCRSLIITVSVREYLKKN